jgi:hypothetical protein
MELGSVNAASPGSLVFFGDASFSLFSTTRAEKKLSNAVAFSSVASAWMHCKNHEQICVGSNI